MKTNNISKKSFLMTMILALSAGMASIKNRNNTPAVGAGGGTTVFHSHGSFHRRGKVKGWMRENRKCSFNKNR